jgi:hypothetical protein
MPYLSQRALAGLKAYMYKPTGYTLLDRLHDPFFRCEGNCGVQLVWLQQTC